MTTPAAATTCEAQHNLTHEGECVAIYNPDNIPIKYLSVIYGFNNGGSDGWYRAVLLSEHGTFLGAHIYRSESEECMPADLGILEGTRLDRHEYFRKHYPRGYRMEFVGFNDVRSHAGIDKALTLSGKRR